MLRLIALAGLAMTMAGSPAAVAQDATFYTVTYVEVGPVLAKVGAAALKGYRDASRKDAGAVHLDVYQRIDRPNQFVVLGSWTNQMAYDAHASGDNVKKLNEKLGTTLAARPTRGSTTGSRSRRRKPPAPRTRSLRSPMSTSSRRRRTTASLR